MGKQLSLSRLNDIRDNFFKHKNHRIKNPSSISLTKATAKYIERIENEIKNIENTDSEYAQYKMEYANNCFYDYFTKAFEKSMDFWKIEIKKEVNKVI